MKFHSILAIAFAAVSANAAVLVARDISPPVQLCIDKIGEVQVQLGVVTQGVTDWTIESGYLGALIVQEQEQILEQKLISAGTECCKVTETVTAEEADAVLAEVVDLVPAVEDSLNIIIQRKPDFDQVPLVTNLVVTDLIALKGQTDTLDTCLLAATPASHLDQANDLVDAINTAFAAAFEAYNI